MGTQNTLQTPQPERPPTMSVTTWADNLGWALHQGSSSLRMVSACRRMVPVLQQMQPIQPSLVITLCLSLPLHKSMAPVMLQDRMCGWQMAPAHLTG